MSTGSTSSDQRTRDFMSRNVEIQTFKNACKAGRDEH